MDREELIDNLTEILLVARGFDRDDSPLEWDGTDEESQYSLMREDISDIIEALYQLGFLDI